MYILGVLTNKRDMCQIRPLSSHNLSRLSFMGDGCGGIHLETVFPPVFTGFLYISFVKIFFDAKIFTKYVYRKRKSVRQVEKLRCFAKFLNYFSENKKMLIFRDNGNIWTIFAKITIFLENKVLRSIVLSRK